MKTKYAVNKSAYSGFPPLGFHRRDYTGATSEHHQNHHPKQYNVKQVALPLEGGEGGRHRTKEIKSSLIKQ